MVSGLVCNDIRFRFFRLPQKLGIVWHRKGKDDLRIDTARNYVPKPDDPFQGSAHFFDPAKSAYDYVTFDTGFILVRYWKDSD